MKKYTVTYTRNGKEIKTTRKAKNALEAVEKICDQHGWNCKLKYHDADTHGSEWAVCSVAVDGGINWSFSALAELAE